MDHAVYNALKKIMIDDGLSADSSDALAFHIAQHYPEHGLALLRAASVEIEPDLPIDLTATTE